MESAKARKGDLDWELKSFKILILLFFVYLLLPVFGINLINIFPEKKHYDLRPVYSYEYFQVGLSQAETKGNWSYIPINIEGFPRDYSNYVMSLVREFEEKKNLKVLNRWFDVDDHLFTPPFFSGIWLNHEPRN